MKLTRSSVSSRYAAVIFLQLFQSKTSQCVCELCEPFSPHRSSVSERGISCDVWQQASLRGRVFQRWVYILCLTVS